MGKLGGYLRLMRPVNCLMMGFAVVVGAALASRMFQAFFGQILSTDSLPALC